MNIREIGNLLVRSAIFLAFIAIGSTARAEDEKKITNGTCGNLTKDQIPLGDFRTPRQMPQAPLGITQKYNTTWAEGYWYKKVRYYGHDGLDTEGESETEGVNDVSAVFDGIVILSWCEYKTGGWGESMILATRVNEYSEEILTEHFHHIHSEEVDGEYSTTRKFNACDVVNSGDVIAKEGTTGKSTGSHLHLGIRRWKNIAELNKAIENEGKSLFGYGYVFSNTSRLVKNLDPQGLLFDTYLDYQGEQQPYFWSYPYVLQMRENGFEFGGSLGEFGAQVPATRRTATKWIKIASGRESIYPSTATFEDVPKDNSIFPYVEALTRYPSVIPVINPDHSCQSGGKFFCPDQNISRPEALKMVITAFFEKEFLKVYNDQIWKSSYAAGLAILQKLQDVDPWAWYAPYVYFGTNIGLVSLNENFYPEVDVMNEELAKWVILGYGHLTQSIDGPCQYTSCPLDYICDPSTGDCYPLPVCVPSETQNCDIGGGYEPETDCTPGETIGCVLCGQQVCDSLGNWEVCQNQGICTPGQTEIQSCNGTGTRQRTCISGCIWGSWGQCSIQPVCTPGQTEQQSCNGGTGTQTRTCNSNGQWGAWGACITNCDCSSGICCDGCNYKSSGTVCDSGYVYQCEGPNPGQDPQQAQVQTYCTGNSTSCSGQTQQYGWQDIDNCTSNEVCVMNGGYPQCVYVCQDTYLASTSQSCYNNPQGSGNPTLCLKVQQVSGSSWQYQVCKSGGTFSNNFYYQLKDLNHSVNFTKYTGAAGVTCTPWKNFSISYVTANGPVNGAGLSAEVKSPTSCSQSSCIYRTGSITVYKDCQ